MRLNEMKKSSERITSLELLKSLEFFRKYGLDIKFLMNRDRKYVTISDILSSNKTLGYCSYTIINIKDPCVNCIFQGPCCCSLSMNAREYFCDCGGIGKVHTVEKCVTFLVRCKEHEDIIMGVGDIE